MADRQTVRAELEEQRLLIERQQVEILRQQHQIEMQRRRTAHLEAELEAIKVTLQRDVLPTIQPGHGTPKNGNGHRRGRAARGTAAISSSDHS